MITHKIKLGSILTSKRIYRFFSNISDNESKGIKLFEKYYKTQNVVPSHEWESFIKCLKIKLPLTIRINKDPYNHYLFLKSYLHENLKHNWMKDDKKFKIIEWYPDKLAVQIKAEDTRSKELQFFLLTEKKSGGIFIQETVSLIPVLLLDIEPYHHVLDLCASPGAKATQILQMFTSIDIKRKGFLIANDLKNKRNRTLVLQSKKFNFCSFAITKCNALKFPVLFDNVGDDFKFDRILCDVTCSGDGTARKNGLSDWEIDYCNSFHEKQLQIARRGVKLLKKGGIMVYSTCSFNPVENEAVVATIIEEAKGSLELIDLHVKLKGLKTNQGLNNWEVKTNQLSLDKQINQDNKVKICETMFPPKNISSFNIQRCIRILPHHQDTGAFFVAAFKKIQELPVSFQSLGSKFPSINKMPSINFINESDDEWQTIKLYYGLKDFPYSQLMYQEVSNYKNKAHQNLSKSENSNLSKRNIYFVNESLKQFIMNNFFNLNYFHVGLRVFVRINKDIWDTEFRLSQEGLPIIFPYLSSERLVEISKEQLRCIMLGKHSELKDLSERLGKGCFVLNCKHSDGDNNVNIPFAVLVKSKILPLLHFNEKIHLLRVAGLTK